MPKKVNKELDNIRALVGNVTVEDLKNVDYYIGDRLSIFIPSVGYCQYAIKPNHTHPTYSFVLFFSKEQNFFVDPIEISKGHYLAAILSPEIPHQEEPGDQFTRYVAIFIEKDFYEERYLHVLNRAIERFDSWKQFPVSQEIMIDIKRFMTESESLTIGYEKMQEALTELITVRLIRSQNHLSNAGDSIVDEFDMERVIEFMEQNFGEPISLKSLSKRLGMSQSQFSRRFKKETGLSPFEYFMKIRIEKAQKLLRSNDKNITEIAQFCGFGSTSHFSTSFRNHLGMSPSDYRSLYNEHK